MPKTLTELAIEFGSDKYYSHSYIEFYSELFADRDVKRLLEVGIGYRDLMAPFTPKFVPGSSLRMWAEYWPNAEIYACDIREDVLINEGRIHSMVCDQSSGDSLAMMVDAFTDGFSHRFDVVIDDGSHLSEHQILTARCLIAKGFAHSALNASGVYVIEDCREPERVADAVGGEIHRFDKRPDDCLVVCRL